MKIGMIGAGNIGGTLGEKWAAAGHEVVFGVRNPKDEKYAGLRTSGTLATPGEAAQFGEVVVLALPNRGVVEFATAYGPDLDGRLVVDTTNDFGAAVMHKLDVLAEKAPGARPARAFNSQPWENFADPQLGGMQIDHFFCCGAGERPVMERLIAEIGLRPVYLGGLETAAALDGLTRVWAALAFGQGLGRRVGFKLLAEEGG